jgi:hypothetical protein
LKISSSAHFFCVNIAKMPKIRFNTSSRISKSQKEKWQKEVPSTGIEPVTFRFEIIQLQPNVIANYTTRGSKCCQNPAQHQAKRIIVVRGISANLFDMLSSISLVGAMFLMMAVGHNRHPGSVEFTVAKSWWGDTRVTSWDRTNPPDHGMFARWIAEGTGSPKWNQQNGGRTRSVLDLAPTKL